jgi:hypothetical protein
MQERTENESKINYWYKQYLKAPAQLVGFGALLALCFIYHESKQGEKDFRAYMSTQLERSYAQNEKLLSRIEEETRTLAQMTTQLELLNNRVGHLEREHEITRQRQHEENSN